MDSTELTELLERTRKKLLDLTNRNRLLNYPKNKTSNRLIIIDELPNQLFSSLVDEDRPMLFKAVPIPTFDELESFGLTSMPDVKQRAISLGLNPSHIAPENEEIPSRIHSDNYIQTLHYPKDMDKILGRINSEAREIIEETGANMLYLVIGFLEWNDYKDDTKRFAPLIMIPVQLEKDSLDPLTQSYTYKISYTDEDIVSNLALKVKLEQDMGIQLPELKEGMNPEEYLLSFNTLLSNNPTFKLHREFTLDFLKFAKILMYLDLDPKRWPKGKDLTKNPTLTKIFYGNHDSEIAMATDYPIDKTKEADKTKLIVDADSSQHSAIIDVYKNKNIVIEGPPGTGKSQTITNIIATAICEGKKVLFVAEKLAALDVVKARLEENDLGDFCFELHSHKSHKQRVYQDLAKRIEGVYSSPLDISVKIKELQSLKDDLNKYTLLLSKHHANAGLNFQSILGNAEFYRIDNFTPLIISDANTLNENDRSKHELAINSMSNFLMEHPAMLSSPLAGFYPNNAIKLDADDIALLWMRYSEITKQLHEKAKIFENSLDFPINTLEEIGRILDVSSKPFFDTLPNDEIISAIYDYGLDKAQSDLRGIESIIANYKSLPKINFDMLVEESDLKSYEQTLMEYKDSNWIVKLFSGNYRNVKRKAKIMFPSLVFNEINSEFKSARLFIAELRKYYLEDETTKLLALAPLINTRVEQKFSIESIPLIMDSFQKFSQLGSACNWIDEFQSSQLPNKIKHKVISGEASSVHNILVSFKTTFISLLHQHTQCVENLLQYGPFIIDEFYGSNIPPLTTMIEKHTIVDNLVKDFGNWIEYSRNSDDIRKQNLEWIIVAIKNESIQINDAIKAYRYSYYHSLAMHIMRGNKELGGFSRQSHEQKILEFQKLDQKIIHLNRQLIASNASNVVCPHGVQSGKVGNLTEMGLLKNEIRKRIRHIPIRAALLRAPKSIQALKPCFMMSPMSCAQYLAPGAIEFDIIVMDEASQIRPEDALGALSRAKQVVVVGDPKQLPPTSFFDRKFNTDGDDDDQTLADDSESILDVCLKAFPSPRRLSWHYRSQHESLIAFSNQQFYGGKEGKGLMLFPSPKEAGNEYGIKRHYIEDGRFINQYNIEEAKVVVEAVIRHFKSGSQESLGVVSMNLNQARYIGGLLDDARKRDLSLDRSMESAGENGHSFFVKNLENVQGDERDVIYISTTYGPDQTGQQHQRFGPINGDHGWRRLNVLITRAKKRVELFTSILSSNIIIAPTSSFGLISLKGYLRFAETKLLEPTHTNYRNKAATPDSPFEEAVAAIIKMAGYDVDIQVGAAGYFIDIAVRHPANSSEYLLAVECDGASYHSSSSARDRDRLRETVLRRMGWEVHRIWSTDWFNNRDIEITRLLNAIDEAIKSRPMPVLLKENVVAKEKQPKVVSPEIKTIKKAINNPDETNVTNLKKQLIEFRENIIASRYTIDRHCLLSDDMIEAFVHTNPINKQEFRAKISEASRININIDQMEYIEDVLSIIENQS